MNTLVKVAFLSLMPLSMLGAATTGALSQEIVEQPYEAYDPADDDGPLLVDQGEDALIEDDSISVADGSMERCAATFRSFDAMTGNYTGYDGLVRRCPYLE